MIVIHFYSSTPYSIPSTIPKKHLKEGQHIKNIFHQLATFRHIWSIDTHTKTHQEYSTTGSYNILMFESYVFIFFVFYYNTVCCAAMLCVGWVFCVQARKFFVFLSITFSKQRIEILNGLWFKKALLYQYI